MSGILKYLIIKRLNAIIPIMSDIEKAEEYSIDNSYRWIIIDNQISMRVADEVRYVSSEDIVRAEFKGGFLVDKVISSVKPSDHLQSIHFNRFPCDLKLALKMPSSTIQRPVLELVAIVNQKIISISKVPAVDQIIDSEMNWFPIFPEDITDINNLLETANIIELGRITVKQAFDLIKEESPLILISSVQVDSSDPNLLYNHLEQDLKLLTDNGFHANLYPYQKNGFTWLKSVSEEGLGCILADEMGLGKTLQIIAVLSYYKIKWKLPSLIIAPATLLENWHREFSRFSPKVQVHIHSGRKRTGFPSLIKKFDIVVCSYDTAIRDQGLFGMIDWGFIILDEAQAIKNNETNRAIAVKGLKRRVGIAVTGTPVENKLLDLWSIMDFSCPRLLGSHNAFEKNYTDEPQSAEKLEMIVSPFMLRRRIADVASDLPEKIIIPQPVNMEEHEINDYELVRQNIAEEYGKSATLISLLRLRQFCSHPLLLGSNKGSSGSSLLISSKYRRFIEILEEIVLNHEKMIVFTSFTAMSDIFLSDIPTRFNIPAWKIDGRTLVDDRQHIVDNFSNVSDSAMLILNPKAAGTGLNITAANHVIHYTLEWNPAIEDQATARSFRRGQTLPVTVHRLYYPDTVEDIINERLDRKRLLAEKAVVGTESPEMDASDISRAINLSPLGNSFKE